MNRFKKTSAAVAAVISALAITPAVATQGNRIGNFDFSYAMSGDAKVAPVQVFDNGTKTYFQFRPGEAVPAIFYESGGKTEFLFPRYEGPYVVVDGLHGHFVLGLGRNQARVIHTLGTRPDDLPVKQVFENGMTTPYQGGSIKVGAKLVVATTIPDARQEPTLSSNSYATPMKGDKVQWMNPVETQDYSIPFVTGVSRVGPVGTKTARAVALTLKDADRIEITGRDDGGHKEGIAEARAAAIADLFASLGIPRSRIFMKTSAAVKTSHLRKTTVGVSIVAYSSTVYEPPKPAVMMATARTSKDRAVETIVADLTAGRITPSQASAALANVKISPPVTVGAPAASGAPATLVKWNMKASDAFVDNTIKRWGLDSGWTVINKGAPQIPVYGDAVVEGPDFLKATDYVITQAKQGGYHIKATAYSNKVLVLTEEATK